MPLPGDDPRVDELALEIGHALADWGSVETHLSMLFDNLSGIDNLSRTQIITASIVNFDARIDICDNLMRFEAEDALNLAVWTKLSAKVRKFYKKRHEIAHFTLFISNPNGVAQARCHPFWSIGSNLLGRNKTVLTAADIRSRAKIFRD